MKSVFYIPIESKNLAHYLGGGIIAPSKYIENKNVDIQDEFKNFLLLCSSKFTNESNCAIEIFLGDEEAIKISDNFYLIEKPLPISRIKNIYFKEEEQKVSTHFNVTVGDAFLPEHLFKVSKDMSVDTKELNNIKYQGSEIDWSTYIRKYDKVLGGFAVMTTSKESFQNYPTHYFSTLGNINEFFSNSLKEQNVDIENSYKFALNNDGKFKDFHDTIYSEIDFAEVERYAEKDKVNLEVKNGIIQIDKIPDNTSTYLVAILDSYGKNKRKKVDTFISDFFSGKFNEKKKEGLSLIFGINKGYKAFRNRYKTENFEVDIKFHLNCKLDYYIIESIYQKIFNSRSNVTSFQYIDKYISNCEMESKPDSKFMTYNMVDKVIVWKEKVLTPYEMFVYKIVKKISNWFPSFISVKKNEIENLFRADFKLLESSIEEEVNNIFNHELEQNKLRIAELENELIEKNSKISELLNKLRGDIKPQNEYDVTAKKDIQKTEINDNVHKKIIIEMKGSLFPKTKSREEELNDFTVPQLKDIAKSHGIKIKTGKKKMEIINEILIHEKSS